MQSFWSIMLICLAVLVALSYEQQNPLYAAVGRGFDVTRGTANPTTTDDTYKFNNHILLFQQPDDLEIIPLNAYDSSMTSEEVGNMISK